MTRVRLPAVALIAALAVAGCVFEQTELDVTAPTTLRVGETVQLSVIQRLSGGSAT